MACKSSRSAGASFHPWQIARGHSFLTLLGSQPALQTLLTSSRWLRRLSSPNTVTYDNQNTSFVYSGNWQANKTASGIPSTQSELPFHTTSEKGASAHLNFTGRSVAVYGSTTFGHGLYTVVRTLTHWLRA